MSLFSRISGVVNNFFQLGGPGGPGWNRNSAALEGRNSTNTGFAVVRGDTPVAGNDLTTKTYVDSSIGGSISCIDFAISTGSSQSSSTSIPANAVIVNAKVNIEVAYSGGATLSIGQTGSTSLLLATSDNVPQTIDLYEGSQRTSWGSSALPVLVTITGSPSTGSGHVTVLYSVPNA